MTGALGQWDINQELRVCFLASGTEGQVEATEKHIQKMDISSK